MEHQTHHLKIFKTKLLVSAILTVPILLFSHTIQEWLRLTFLKIPFQNEVLLALSTVIYIYGGLPFLQGLAQEIRKKQPGMMTLIGTAISVAFIYSAATVFGAGNMDFFWELATLIDIMLLGHWLEMRSLLGASKALEELARLMPQTAHLIINGNFADVPIAQLKTGDLLLVRPGEKIPSDALVEDGESWVNEALLTGESKPAKKKVGDLIIGGAVNGEGALRVRVKRTGNDTYLAQVIRLVTRAQESRSRTQDLANRAAALLFYVAIGTGVITFVVWSLITHVDIALTRTVTVLVIACPHALGLAIPLVVAISTSITARNGVLIRDRKAFETMKDVNAVVFDKTGTLTQGQFGVTDLAALIPEGDLLAFTASVEVNSEHVIAKALVDYARAKDVEILQIKDFKALPGKGAFGKFGQDQVYVGSLTLVEELNIDVDNEQINNWQKQGKTVVYTIMNGKLVGAFALADQVRPESKEAVAELKENGLKVYILTGDSAEVADEVSKELGIDEYFAKVTPDKKADKIKELQHKGLKVAMVGDGVNDAPALVTADVGVAVGAGTDVAIESADIILVRNDPRDVPKVMTFSKKTYSKMMQNLWWAAGYNVIAIPLAAGALSGYGFVLPPQVGALVMSLSTVIVAINAQTLRRYKIGGSTVTSQKIGKTAEMHNHHH